jgi:hypothetical protein
VLETVTFLPKGRFGNALFQYAAAKLLAHLLGAKMHNPLESAALHDIVVPERCRVPLPSRTVGEREFKSLMRRIDPGDAIAEIHRGRSRSLSCLGFFQYSWALNRYQDVVKTFFALTNQETNVRDIAVHLRLGDFGHQGSNSGVIDHRWYLEILRRTAFDKLYIVTDEIKSGAEERYLRKFDEFNPTIVSNSAREDFEFLRRFRKIILSNSTFGWWAAYLGAAEEITLPKNFNRFGVTKRGRHGHQEIYDVRGLGERVPCRFINIYELS